MKRQFTATAYIFEEERVLLIYHRKLKKWLPPGGHVDPNELPSETAIREAKEETGLEIELITDEHLHIDRFNARSYPRPFLCLLEEIPEHKGEPAHQHMDSLYVARRVGGTLLENKSETDGIHWFSQEELNELVPDEQIFSETLETLHYLFERHRAHAGACWTGA